MDGLCEEKWDIYKQAFSMLWGVGWKKLVEDWHKSLGGATRRQYNQAYFPK